MRWPRGMGVIVGNTGVGEGVKPGSRVLTRSANNVVVAVGSFRVGVPVAAIVWEAGMGDEVDDGEETACEVQAVKTIAERQRIC